MTNHMLRLFCKCPFKTQVRSMPVQNTGQKHARSKHRSEACLFKTQVRSWITVLDMTQHSIKCN